MNLTELVQQAKEGNGEAMGELYQQTNRRVYTFALRMTNNEEQALDVVQETYLSAMTHLDELRNPDAFIGWLFQIAVNHCRKLYRKEKHYVSPEQFDEQETNFFEQLPDLDEQVLPEEAISRKETKKQVMDFVNQLPNEQKEAILLYYFSGCSIEQIAQIQECSEGTVKSRLNYGRKKLKECVLELEKRDGIRIHVLLPIGSIFSCAPWELPDPTKWEQIWQTVAAGIGGGGISAGAASAAVLSGEGTSTSGAAVAAKSVATAWKVKIVSGVAAGAVLAGGIAVALQSPEVEFHDPTFEQNVRLLLDQPTGKLSEKDLESIHTLYILEDGMAIEWGMESQPEPKEGTALVDSLVDLSLFPKLQTVEYFIEDGGALLKTAGENEYVDTFLTHISWDSPSALSEFTFLEAFPNLEYVTVHTVANIDFTPLENMTGLKSLMLYSNGGNNTFCVDQLSELVELGLRQPEEGNVKLQITQSMPNMRLLDLLGGTKDAVSLENILSYLPELEYIKVQRTGDHDLTPLGQLEHLRAAVIDFGQDEVDFTPLLNCPNLEVCTVMDGYDKTKIPSQIYVDYWTESKAFDISSKIMAEVRNADKKSN